MGKGPDWRDCEQPYHSDGADFAQVAFEFLRRNDTYQHDFASLPSAKSPRGEIERDIFARRWGLRFRG